VPASRPESLKWLAVSAGRGNAEAGHARLHVHDYAAACRRASLMSPKRSAG
jgi:hypothetical protein